MFSLLATTSELLTLLLPLALSSAHLSSNFGRSEEEKFTTPFASEPILTTSPFLNLPSTEVIPQGRRLLPFLTALSAPASTFILPFDAAQRIHRCRLLYFTCAVNRVPISS